MGRRGKVEKARCRRIGRWWVRRGVWEGGGAGGCSAGVATSDTDLSFAFRRHVLSWTHNRLSTGGKKQKPSINSQAGRELDKCLSLSTRNI